MCLQCDSCDITLGYILRILKTCFILLLHVALRYAEFIDGRMCIMFQVNPVPIAKLMSHVHSLK